MHVELRGAGRRLHGHLAARSERPVHDRDGDQDALYRTGVRSSIRGVVGSCVSADPGPFPVRASSVDIRAEKQPPLPIKQPVSRVERVPVDTWQNLGGERELASRRTTSRFVSQAASRPDEWPIGGMALARYG